MFKAFLLLYILAKLCSGGSIVYKDEKDLTIVGGNLTNLHQFPYHVGIFMHQHLDRKYSFCGGSIISENYVLTAARCFKPYNISTLNVLFGARNVSNWEPGYQYMTIRVSNTSVIVHENYSHEGYKNDIALIKLDQNLVYNDGIQPVKLPELDARENVDYVGQVGIIAGWGHYKEDEFGISPQLNFVHVQVISNEKCKSYDIDYEESVDSNNLCTSGDGVIGFCDADYGGALVINDTQIAIISWYWDERETCFISMPNVYTKVAPFRRWIKEISGV